MKILSFIFVVLLTGQTYASFVGQEVVLETTIKSYDADLTILSTVKVLEFDKNRGHLLSVSTNLSNVVEETWYSLDEFLTKEALDEVIRSCALHGGTPGSADLFGEIYQTCIVNHVDEDGNDVEVTAAAVPMGVIEMKVSGPDGDFQMKLISYKK